MAPGDQRPANHLSPLGMIQAELDAQETDDIKDILSLLRFKGCRSPDNYE
jgi:hypothetical protein